MKKIGLQLLTFTVLSGFASMAYADNKVTFNATDPSLTLNITQVAGDGNIVAGAISGSGNTFNLSQTGASNTFTINSGAGGIQSNNISAAVSGNTNNVNNSFEDLNVNKSNTVATAISGNGNNVYNRFEASPSSSSNSVITNTVLSGAGNQLSTDITGGTRSTITQTVSGSTNVAMITVKPYSGTDVVQGNSLTENINGSSNNVQLKLTELNSAGLQNNVQTATVKGNGNTVKGLNDKGISNQLNLNVQGNSNYVDGYQSGSTNVLNLVTAANSASNKLYGDQIGNANLITSTANGTSNQLAATQTGSTNTMTLTANGNNNNINMGNNVIAGKGYDSGQYGNANVMTVVANGNGNVMDGLQVGNSNTLSATFNGNSNTGTFIQNGSNMKLNFSYTGSSLSTYKISQN